MNSKLLQQNEQGINIKDVQHFKNYKEKHFIGHKKCPTALAWNTDGALFVTAEMVIKLWAFNQKHGLQKLSQVKGHETNIDHAQFCNTSLLGTMSRESIRFWDVRQNLTARQLKIEKKSKQEFIAFAWSHGEMNGDSLRLAVLNKENVVGIYDYRNLTAPVHSIPPKPNSIEICALGWDRSDSVLFLAGGQSSTGSINLYHGEKYQLLCDPITTHCGRITDIAFSRNNDKFATASEDSLLEIHCIPQIICERVFSHKIDSSFRRVSFSCDGKYVAGSCDSNSIEIYNLENGGQAHRIKCSQSQEMLSWHPKRMVLAYLDEEDKKKSLDRGDESYVHLFSQ